MIDARDIRQVQLKMEAVKIELELLLLNNPDDKRFTEALRLLQSALWNLPGRS